MPLTVQHEAMKVMRDLEKSAADSTARSRENYKRDPEKSRTDSAAQSKANYDKDVKASRTLKRQRYVIPCLCSFYVYVHSMCTFILCVCSFFHSTCMFT